MPSYQFSLLRYQPTTSGEFYNLAVILFDPSGRILDARFATEFDRMRSNPAVEVGALAEIRDEFEEHRLLGEAFRAYFEQLSRNLSDSLQLTAAKPFDGADSATEMDRLAMTYLATPPALPESSGRLSGRLAVRRAVGESLRRRGLLVPGAVRENVELSYGAPRLSFRFDYGYETRGNERFVHALGLHSAVREATRLCFVMDRLRVGAGPTRSLTAVYEEGIVDEALEVLELSSITPAPTGQIEDLTLGICRELGR